MRLLLLLAFLILTSCATNADRFPSSEKKTIDNNFVLANYFWDNDHYFIVNDTSEYYHYTYKKSPFTLGSAFGKTWRIKKDRLQKIYQLPQLSDFGTFSAFYNEKFLYLIRTNQYYLGSLDGKQKFGVRFLPYDDEKDSYEDLDEYVRARQGLGPDDVFVAPTYYFHPEYNRGDVLQLDKSSRFDDGFTHMGAYIGKGQTRNSPYDYHDMKLKTKGYPANLTRVVYKGAKSQKEFQKNFYIALKLLNELNGGVKFARLDYQQDYYDANNLKSIFDFYRAWLDPKWVRNIEDGKPFYEIILEDVKYDVYCSEHIAMVLNVAINLVQTEAGYVRVFGKNSEQLRRGSAPQESDLLKGGEYFWALAQKRWSDEIKEELPEVDDKSITELWKLYNKTSSPIVTKITEVGLYLAWPPQTLTDLIANVMTLYARFDLVGKDVALKTLNAMKALILSRVTFADKTKVFIKNSVIDFPTDKLDALMKPFEDLVNRYWIVAKYKGPKRAYEELQLAAHALVMKYRDPKFLKIKPDSFFYYATPHVIHRVVQGLHPYSKYLEFEILGTVLPLSDLELTNN